MPNGCLTPIPAPCAPATTDLRVVSTFTRRYNTARRQTALPAANHTTNGDETLPDKVGTYSKGILQDGQGKVNLPAFSGFQAAIAAGTFSAFESITPGGSRTQNGPMGAYAYEFVGADGSQFGGPMPVPIPPNLTSAQYGAELIELYWCSLLRDVPFTQFAGNATAQAAATELTSLAVYKGPRDGGTVKPSLLFRGCLDGEKIGPYISQFFLTPTVFGALPFHQKYITYMPNVDYMTDEPTWEDVQNGIATGVADQVDPVHRYLHDGRGLAAFTHVDELYQSYFTAYLVMNALKVPVNPGNPYVNSKKQNGFGTFGGPDFASVLAQVAKAAINAVWYQKWVVHLRHRPESGAGLVHYSNKGVSYSAVPHASVFGSQALAHSFSKYGTYFLSQPFPEGSPAHPAYPTGHGSVGGACITVLKFFFDGKYTIPNPQMPAPDGLSLLPWDYDPATGDPGVMTVNGELHKLAHNVTFGHGLHGGIHWRSDSDSSIALGEAVAISFLEDLVCTYAEPFTITITKTDGTPHTFSNP